MGTVRHPSPRASQKEGARLVVAAVILLVVGLALIVGAGVIWWQSQQAYNENVEEYHQLADANVTEDTSTGRPVVDFAALKALNPQIVGWIQIPQTPVNYPVCQTDNNDYYLNHSFLGRDDEFGAIFMDYRSAADLSGYNTVMYGHHLKNGEMFAEVADYSNQENFDTIRNIYYVSEDRKGPCSGGPVLHRGERLRRRRHSFQLCRPGRLRGVRPVTHRPLECPLAACHVGRRGPHLHALDLQLRDRERAYHPGLHRPYG